MDLFAGGKLNLNAFDLDVRRGTHDLSDVLAAAARTGSSRIESTHFLIATAAVPDGATRRCLSRLGITVEQWQGGLSECAGSDPGCLPPAHLLQAELHPSALAMLETARECCGRFALPRISEPVLLLSGLAHVTPAVRELCDSADINLDDWRAELERDLRPVTPPAIWEETPPHSLRLEVFSPGARRILTTARSEAEALGYAAVDPRHLLLALLAREGGATRYGLHQQGMLPRRVHEGVMLSLRGKAKRTPSRLPLDREHLQATLQSVLRRATELAARDGAPVVAEPHLLRAFLAVESAARTILEDEKVAVTDLLRVAESYEAEEEETEDESAADIETVRGRLGACLVGQEDAIERILPYVQRVRFGFSTPERPVGVFLFCGQSGSGKTEMAKELARAVYGSVENLIFLEMGLFNAPESMNIFVGAPPGYVGYGEGKLTNGLRDRPRSVVLFDEVEKAHSRVHDALLRFLDEGRIDDPAGPVRDGSQCIVILTSNVGAEELPRLWATVKGKPNWRSLVRDWLREEFKKRQFRVEFLNRVDELVLFRSLEEEDYAEIARRLLERDLARLRAEKQIDVVADPGVAAAIGEYCGALSEGARAARRLVQSVVITPVIDFVVRHSCQGPVRLRVSAARADGDPEPRGVVEWAA